MIDFKRIIPPLKAISVPGLFVLYLPITFILWMPMWLMSKVGLPKWVFQTFDDWYYGIFKTQIVIYLHKVCGMRVHFYGDLNQMVKGERVLLISNHQNYADWSVMEFLASRQKCLGHVRFIIMDKLKYTPFYGLCTAQHGYVFVRKKEHFSEKQFREKLIRFRDPSIRSWMVLFPEGRRFLVSEGNDPKEHVLKPKTRGFTMIQEHLHDSLDALYDVTVVYGDSKDKLTGQRRPTPSFWDLLTGRSNDVHVHIRRFTMSSVWSSIVPEIEVHSFNPYGDAQSPAMLSAPSTTLESFLKCRFNEKNEILRDHFRGAFEDSVFKVQCSDDYLYRPKWTDGVSSYLVISLPTVLILYFGGPIFYLQLWFGSVAFSYVCLAVIIYKSLL